MRPILFSMFLMVKADSAGQWIGSVEGLPKYQAGQLVQYQVREQEVKGYEASYETKADNQFVVTNTLKESLQRRVVKRVPKTGIPTGTMTMASLLVISLIGLWLTKRKV